MGTEVIEPRSSLDIAGVNGASATDSIVMYSVNAPPTATVMMHGNSKLAGEGAMEVTNAQLALGVGDMQDLMAKPRRSPDSSISMFDGKNSLTFKGYVVNPQYSLATGDVGLRTSLAHESAGVSQLDYSIYDTDTAHYRESLVEVDPATLPERIKELSELIVQMWKENRDPPSEAISKQAMIKNKLHTANGSSQPLWFKILENSKDAAWPEINKLPGDTKVDGVNKTIIGILRQAKGNFFDTILRIGNAFQLVWVPSMQPGEVGKFIPYSSLVEGSAKLEVTPITMSFSAGNDRLVPVSHVTIHSGAVFAWREDNKGRQAVPTAMVAAWPETPYAGGGRITDPGPQWIKSVQIKPESLRTGDYLSLSAYRNAKNGAIKETIAKDATPKMKVLTKWARNMYADQALGYNSANIMIPLDLSVELGKRYSVKAGSKLFSGFLTSIEHRVAVTNTHTMLFFSHVETGNFTLKNK